MLYIYVHTYVVSWRQELQGREDAWFATPAASMIATNGTCVYGFHSLSISDDTDKSKEKLIKVAKEMQCGDRWRQILEKLTLIAESTVNSLADVTQFVSRTAYRKTVHVLSTLYTELSDCFICLYVNKFKSSLGKFLHVGSFYSLGEYFEWKIRDDLKSYK
jgi:hypothetical protein